MRGSVPACGPQPAVQPMSRLNFPTHRCRCTRIPLPRIGSVRVSAIALGPRSPCRCGICYPRCSVLCRRRMSRKLRYGERGLWSPICLPARASDPNMVRLEGCAHELLSRAVRLSLQAVGSPLGQPPRLSGDASRTSPSGEALHGSATAAGVRNILPPRLLVVFRLIGPTRAGPLPLT